MKSYWGHEEASPEGTWEEGTTGGDNARDRRTQWANPSSGSWERAWALTIVRKERVWETAHGGEMSTREGWTSISLARAAALALAWGTCQGSWVRKTQTGWAEGAREIGSGVRSWKRKASNWVQKGLRENPAVVAIGNRVEEERARSQRARKIKCVGEETKREKEIGWRALKGETS